MTVEMFSVEVERRIEAAPDVVFRYLTESDRLTKWMGTNAEIDARPGGGFRIEVPGGAAAVGEYLVVEPPELLVYTWGWENNNELPPGSSTVEITLRADGEATILILRHANLPDEPTSASHRAGWGRYLGRLAIAAEGGNPGLDADAETVPETRGVAVTELATVDLAGEIEGMAGRRLRMRMVTIEPGGVFGPIHDHKGRPGIVYILQGTITDHRDGVATAYGPGLGWPEDRNTLHWLENRGTIPAVEISVDIVSQE